MSGFPLANFTLSDQGLFSTSEIRELMRIEHDRAGRYGYPLAMLLIEVDRLESLHDLYGVESKQEILNGVIGLLRSQTRGSDFIGCLDDDRIMAVFPHTDNAAAENLARRLLGASRRLDFESDGRSLRATLSIGVSVTEPDGESSFDQLVETTAEALRFAVVEGGDRFVQRQPAIAYFQELRREIEDEARSLGEEQARMRRERGDMPLFEHVPPPAEPPEPAPAAALPELPDEPVEDQLAERIHVLFQSLDEDEPNLADVERKVIALAQRSVEEARAAVMSELAGEDARKVDVLERRVAKLKDLLDTTEAELLRIARLKNVDTGVASIYKTVQGLADDESEFERKKEMLTLLFEANVDLRRQIEDKP